MKLFEKKVPRLTADEARNQAKAVQKEKFLSYKDSVYLTIFNASKKGYRSIRVWVPCTNIDMTLFHEFIEELRENGYKPRYIDTDVESSLEVIW